MKIPRADIPAAPPRPPRAIDPGAPAESDDALFGFPIPPAEARCVAVPVPYEATVSSRGGTLDGPRAVIAASGQVDFFDPLAGEPWRHGLSSLAESAAIRELAGRARADADAARRGDTAAAARVDDAGREIWDWLDDAVTRLFASGRVPIVLGGEHAISLGALRAAARRHPGLGVLHVDAHADLRGGYEGWATSHASVMRRALELDGLAVLVQVGLRDLGREEHEAAQAAGPRCAWYPDATIAERVLGGESWLSIAREVVARLPATVWISFDVDGLDPSLCPGTGTPVPGGLGWREATLLLAALARSGRTVVGADLVEVGAGWWDGFVAAKLLYLLAGVALGTVPR
ncbi:MAG: arginase family protein [Acidobacteria bacterium]|nr:arginase family protein [Acidobacteriota bacterium]